MMGIPMRAWGPPGGVTMDIRMSANRGFPSLISSRSAPSPRNQRSHGLGPLPATQPAAVRSTVAAPISRGARQLVAANATLLEGATNIGEIGLAEAEKLYTSLPDRSNSKHVMLIMHAPWCSHCKAMEPQVRLLAEGLASESANLSILALECNSPATSAFAKEVLGVPTLPAFCIFPRNCRTFYKFKGKTRDADSLLKFLNMVCNQHEEQLWQLPEATTTTATTSRPTHILSVSTASVPATAAAWAQKSPVSVAIIAVGLVAGFCLLAGAKLLANRQQSEEQGSGRGTAPGDTSLLPASAAPAAGEKRPLEQLLGDIDSSLGRLVGVMLRLVRARVGLVISRADDPAPAPAAAPASKQQQPVVDVEARQVPALPLSNGSAGTPAAGTSADALGPASPMGTGGVRRGGATVGAAIAMPTIAPLEIPDPASSRGASQSGPWEVPASATASERPHSLSSPGISGHAQSEELAAPLDERPAAVPGLTSKAVNGVRLSADHVLSLLAEEGEDVGRVLQRLLQQQDVQQLKAEESVLPPPKGP